MCSCFPGGSEVKPLPAVWETRFDPWVRKIPWRRKWQPTPVLLPGKFRGLQSMGSHKVSDTTEQLHFHFLISPCYSLELCIQMSISFLFTSLLFTAICKASPDSHFAFLHFFSMGMVLIPVSCTMSQTSIHSSSGTLSNRQ